MNFLRFALPFAFILGACTDYEADYEDLYGHRNPIGSVENPSQNTPSDPLQGTGSSNSFTDSRDGQIYNTVTIGSQTWMATNLNYNYYGSYCYDNDVANCAAYGRLYTWEAAVNSCPLGWRLPSINDFEQLINAVDPSFGYGHTDKASSSIAGNYLKSQMGWNGVDALGFGALPGGYRYASGDFHFVGNSAYYWTSAPINKSAFYINLSGMLSDAYLRSSNQSDAMSVRCILN